MESRQFELFVQWKKWLKMAASQTDRTYMPIASVSERWKDDERQSERLEADGQRGRRGVWGGGTDLCVKNINYRRWRNDERQTVWGMDGAKDRWWSGERKQKRKNIREREQASCRGCQRQEVVPGWLAEKEPTVDKCGKMWVDWCKFPDSLLMHVSTHAVVFFSKKSEGQIHFPCGKIWVYASERKSVSFSRWKWLWFLRWQTARCSCASSYQPEWNRKKNISERDNEQWSQSTSLCLARITKCQQCISKARLN